MPTIKINEVDYESNDFSDAAKTELSMLQYVDNRLADLQAQTAVLQTARAAYAAKLARLVEPSEDKQ
jgi:hypothetical protein